MTALIVLGAVAAFFALLLLLPVGADVAFDEGGPQVALRLGPVRLQVLPAKPKKAGGKKAERSASKQKKARKKPAVAAAHRAGGRLEDFRPFVRLGLSFLGALRRRLLVKRLELTITFDGEDPAKWPWNAPSPADRCVLPVFCRCGCWSWMFWPWRCAMGCGRIASIAARLPRKALRQTAGKRRRNLSIIIIIKI